MPALFRGLNIIPLTLTGDFPANVRAFPRRAIVALPLVKVCFGSIAVGRIPHRRAGTRHRRAAVPLTASKEKRRIMPSALFTLGWIS